TLAPWWQDEAAAPPLRILRARILQAQHDFAAAAADLRAALRAAPDSPQALLVLASIGEVTGDHAETKDSCARLAGLRPGLAAAALSLLRGFERIDALYLRLALAAQMAGDPGFAAYRDGVAARYAAARRQGDRLHLRDASRFALEIEHDAARALDFARQNWELHKTPYDARALLAAAIAAGDPAGAQPVIDWVKATRL